MISTHVGPDPDALCSEMALALYLKALGKKVIIVNEERSPERFHFLPGVKQMKAYSKSMKVSYDAAIVVDCGDFKRIGKVAGLIDQNKPLINIDHHVTNNRFGHFNLVDVKSSSTAEVLFELIKASGVALTKSMALHLYAGIMTDTGSFRYENTTARTHRIVSELRQFNFSAYELYRDIYERIPLNDIKHFTKVISSFERLFSGKVVRVVLKKNIVSRFSQEFDLRDTIFKFLRTIKGIEVIVIFTEIGSSKTRINFRSSGKVDVAKLAHRFSGGGHQRASGCTLDKNVEKSKQIIMKEMKGLV